MSSSILEQLWVGSQKSDILLKKKKRKRKRRDCTSGLPYLPFGTGPLGFNLPAVPRILVLRNLLFLHGTNTMGLEGARWAIGGPPRLSTQERGIPMCSRSSGAV